MDIIAEIRRRHFISDESISSIARSLNLFHTTVRKHLLALDEPVYQRKINLFQSWASFKSD